jgi:hypothetical protein
MFRDWSNFFVVTGGAGATLIGLLFIVVALAADRGGRGADQGINAFLTPTLMHFAGTIMQALVMLVPWFAAWPLGVALAILGCAGLAWQLRAFLKLRHAAFVSLGWADWIPHTMIPLLSAISVLAGALGVLTAAAFAPYCVALSSALLLFAGVYRAWDLTLWIVRHHARD